jgi:FkbM family methyltransferase
MLIDFDYLFKKYNVKPYGVLHLGANTGQEAETYQKHGVQRVIWVEADPSLFVRLQQHVRRAAPALAHKCLCECVSDVDGKEVMFNIANNGGQSSSFLELGTHKEAHPTVKYTRQVRLKTIRVDTLFKQEQITLEKGQWFLNADLQGAELLALKGMGELLRRFDWAYVEVNIAQLYKGCPLVSEVDSYLLNFGLQGMEAEMTGAGWGDKFYQHSKLCQR